MSEINHIRLNFYFPSSLGLPADMLGINGGSIVYSNVKV